MAERYNLFQPVNKDAGGTYWHKLGSAFPTRNGNGFNLSFNSLPIPNANGKVIVMMFSDEPRREEKDKAWETPPDENPPWKQDDLDDDIPF